MPTSPRVAGREVVAAALGLAFGVLLCFIFPQQGFRESQVVREKADLGAPAAGLKPLWQELAVCKTHLDDFQARYAKWRKEAGRLSCAGKGMGPTGGFCLTKRRKHVGGNHLWGENFARFMAGLMRNQTVLDLGCGLGHYGKFFRRYFPDIRWLGLDGSEQVEEVTSNLVRFADLSEGLPLDVQRPWDWVISIEVAEHIPRPGEAAFVYNLLRWARVGVVVTWARLGQGGHGHVNCQAASYVGCVMNLMGWELSLEDTNGLRAAAATPPDLLAVPWLVNSTMVFRPQPKEVALQLPLPDAADNAFIQRYFAMANSKCSPALTPTCTPPL
eukprot:RCo044696